MELVERTAYLDILADRYNTVTKGEGHTVFLAGEAGVGKTSLVNHFLQSLSGQVVVYSGACDSLFTPRPLGPLYDMGVQIGQHFLDLLRNEKDRALIFTAFVQELTAATTPVVLVMEDIHWADEATLDFIKFLARRITKFRCLFVLTLRDDEASNRLALKKFFGELPAPTFTKQLVQRLSREAVDQLALAKGYASGHDVYALTGGNPFYVTEVLASYSPGIPERVKDSILTVFFSKDETTRALWEFLSIMPSRVEFNKAALVEEEFPNGIDECIQSGVLVNKGNYLSFKHELYRLAIEESMSPYRRRSLHRRMLKLMLDCPVEFNNLSQVVHHARFADDSEAVARIAPQAAKEAAVLGAHLEASTLYLAAIEHTDAQSPQLVELYENHAYECYLTGQMTAAVASQERVLELWRERKVILKVGDTLRFLSRLWWFAGNRAQSVKLAREAIEVLDNGYPTRERALAYSNMAQLSMLADDPEETLLWGNKAIALATRMNDPEVLSHALNNVGCVLMKFDAEAEGEAKLSESLALALQHGFHEHAARAYTNLSYTFVLSRQHKKAAQVFDEGIKYCEARDLKSWIDYMQSERVKMLLDTGDWAESDALTSSLLSNPFHPPIVQIGALVTRARLKIRQGAFDEARVLLENGKRIAWLTDEAQRVVPVLSAILELCWISGDALPLNDVKKVEDSFFAQKNKSWHYSSWIYWLRKSGVPLPENKDVTFKGPLRLEVEGLWKEAADEWKQSGCVYEQALALMEGDEKHQREGLQLLDELGATATRDKLKTKLKEQGLRNIPRGPRESTRSNPALLTGRQVEILNLLEKGSPNKEIADRLFISPKTVDHHISAILSKLEVNSRAKAVVEARKLGILK
ncbi:helix-turn-helix transcriptional regulator [Chryseolinea lacunae]|uniref:AAA family ATPase n=1 Tax=Chryseolinea lacunae TaxID=2801331 RepID=A0ABS1KNA4_9BACT|nr:AAA family ATPase [Chryseolinea lacunae]MBL0740940.1 AAA family ATPase [Chryseolinea lacunae]